MLFFFQLKGIENLNSIMPDPSNLVCFLCAMDKDRKSQDSLVITYIININRYAKHFKFNHKFKVAI